MGSERPYATRTMYMHKEVLGTDAVVDHINGNPLDNRKENLRISDLQTNSWNTRKHRNGKRIFTSRFKGVFLVQKTKRWAAKIVKDRKRISLGTFATEVEAARAYNEAAVRLFGEFAWLNELG